MRIQAACVALDFGGTIATPGPSPRGADAVEILTERFRWSPPIGFATVIDQVRAEAKAAYRRAGTQVSWETILTTAADRAAAAIPDPASVALGIWERVPDATVDARAAEAVRELRARGFALVLACNTQRPLAFRRATLAAAGLDGLFTDLVLSSEVGVGKPDLRFYAAVARAARTATGHGPAGICFVGDSLARDVLGPLNLGMSAVLVGTDHQPQPLPDGVPRIGHLMDLPALLERRP